MTNRIYCAFGYECNNNCLFCAVDSEAHKNLLLSTTEISRFLRMLENIKDMEIEISGGEPTLRPELFYFLERLNTNFPKIRPTILTNGRKFSDISMAARISEFRPFSLLVPIHGDTPQLHDAITRAQGSFNETLLGVKNLYDYGLTVGLKTIINGLNYKKMPQLVEMIAQRFPECPGIIINGLELQGQALINKDLIGVKLSDTAQYVESALDIAKEYNLKVIVYSIPPCILSEEYRKFSGVKKRSTVISKTPLADMQHVKLTYGTVELCKECRYYPRCTGAWYSYLNVYGTDELKPVK